MHEFYSQYYADLWRRHWWWQVRHEVVMHELSRMLPPVSANAIPPRILDIGCAGGVAFDDFSRFGDVRGIEPDAQLVNSTPHWRSRIEQCSLSLRCWMCLSISKTMSALSNICIHC
jgi:hypothetical protein